MNKNEALDALIKECPLRDPLWQMTFYEIARHKSGEVVHGYEFQERCSPPIIVCMTRETVAAPTALHLDWKPTAAQEVYDDVK